MANKVDDDCGFDEVEVDDSLSDIEEKISTDKSNSDARRRLEKLKEDRYLERLLNNSSDYADY